MADFAGIEFDYRVCVVHQHDGGEREQSKTRFLADLSFVFDAVLCVEFFGAGEGKRVRFDFFAEAEGDFGGGNFVRGAMWSGIGFEAKKTTIGGCNTTQGSKGGVGSNTCDESLNRFELIEAGRKSLRRAKTKC